MRSFPYLFEGKTLFEVFDEIPNFLSIFCVSLAVLLLSCCTVTWLAQNTVRDNSFKPLISYAETLASAIQSEKTQLIKNGALFPYRVTLINPDGSICFDSEADPSHMENHLERQEVRDALQTEHGSATRISDTLSGRTDYYALRLANGQVLRCSATISTIFQNMHLLIAEALGILLFAALISAVLAKHIAKRIVAPINNINLDHPLEADIYDELSPLVKRLESQQKHIDRRTNSAHQAPERRTLRRDGQHARGTRDPKFARRNYFLKPQCPENTACGCPGYRKELFIR